MKTTKSLQKRKTKLQAKVCGQDDECDVEVPLVTHKVNVKVLHQFVVLVNASDCSLLGLALFQGRLGHLTASRVGADHDPSKQQDRLFEANHASKHDDVRNQERARLNDAFFQNEHGGGAQKAERNHHQNGGHTEDLPQSHEEEIDDNEQHDNLSSVQHHGINREQHQHQYCDLTHEFEEPLPNRRPLVVERCLQPQVIHVRARVIDIRSNSLLQIDRP
mmetsp:Transcript_26028/g.68343  ORF Transcript_26028/g.68343 Transcript_26028/m.68343 type:complete len:219 (+) Transcript_26028:296-952(+)